jgi:hypothetical protein
MPYRNPQKLPSDLVQLMGKQIESLEKETFVGLTATRRGSTALMNCARSYATCTLPHSSVRRYEPHLTRCSHQERPVGARTT